MNDLFKERVPFEEAIRDKDILKKAFDDLSIPQQVVLKSLYGLPLAEGKEMRAWAVLQGKASYDALGMPVEVMEWPYSPREYNEMWAVIGRRAGKSLLAAFIVAYEATLGGHLEHVKDGQDVTIYYVAQKLDVAAAQLKAISAFLQESPALRTMIDGKPLADKIILTNGIQIVASSPSLRGQRGLAVPVAVLDECGFWYSDPDAANPDIEVENAIRYAQLQFPHYKRIGISTPWTREGLLWKYYQAGTNGEKVTNKEGYDGVLVHYAPTAAMENPKLSLKALERIYKADPIVYERESLAKFIDSVSGFLPEALISAAVDEGIIQRAPDHSKYQYVAAMDPAFRNDSFGFSVVHKDEHGRVILDAILRWKPKAGQKLNPSEILDEIRRWLMYYNVPILHSDQYHLESLQQLASLKGIIINGLDLTSKSKKEMFGDLETIFRTRSIRLLDPLQGEAMKELKGELVRFEKINLPSGSVRYAAPEGMHDDLVHALALGVHMALRWDVKPQDAAPKAQKGLVSQYLEMLEERRQQVAAQWD